MNFYDSLILGLVEGLTEFLPVSSTGHLILTSNALKLENNEFLKTFEIFIQTGAILSVISIYFKELIKDWDYIKKIILAFIPTAILGLLLHKLIKQYLFNPPVVLTALFVGGIVLLFLERIGSAKAKRPLTLRDYILIGLFQCLAFIPGVSRSAATIMGGYLLGGERAEVVKFSFLLAIPTILSASAYSCLKLTSMPTTEEWQLLAMGTITAFFSGYISVKVFIKLLNHRTFIICGAYRIIFAIAYFALYFL